MATSETTFLQQVADVNQLLQINYKGKVVPWLDVISPVAALFQRLGPGEYSLEGQLLRFAADDTYAGGGMASSGHLPGSQYVDPVNLDTTPARVYVRRMVDNFVVAAGGGEAAFEDFMGRIMRQMWDAFERATIRHIHGSSLATVAVVESRTSAAEIVVRDGYGYPGAEPTMFLEPGMWVASLDTSAAFALLGVAVIDTIERNTPLPGQATITFVTSIEGAGTIAIDDLLVFSTSTDPTDDWFEVERGLAPLGLLDNIDPDDVATSYLTVTEADHPRINPIRTPSADWGEIEFMEWITEIQSRSNSPVTPDSHTFTMQPGVKIELARTIIPFTQIEQKGKELDGGWTAVRLAGYDFIEDSYHLPDVVYGICMEDAFVVPLDGDPRIWEGDGSQFQRLLNFDGKQWWAKHYVQRFMNRRNRSGALTGVTNPNSNRYVPVPSE